MDVAQAIARRRTVRAFGQEPISRQSLTSLVEAARCAPSAANLQPLEYVAVDDPALCQEVFDCLKWAAYTHPVGTPGPGQRPTAYLVVCVRPEYKALTGAAYDLGAALMSAMLLAVAEGLASCWLKSINAPRLAELLNVSAGLEVDSVLALGHPAEEPVIVDLAPEAKGREVIKYWRDEQGRQVVPKRALKSILHWQRHGE
ncbi:MAG: nitroreductase family protein [Desulfarculus sp.]|nr:nitroreductase family protein [Desulfarculus sp.]